MPKVIIIGGGVAGLTSAHELIERGFDVEVYEIKPQHLGGKARSESVPATGPNFLPGEHGFRFFPGFYRHMTHTLKRIPFGTGYCIDNLIPTDKIMFARVGLPPVIATARFPFSPSGLQLAFETITGGVAATGLTSAEKQFFEEKVFQLFTSCKQRFDEEYENIGWWQFMEADSQSATFKKLLVDGLTKTLVAAQARTMNTRIGGSIFLQLLYCLADPDYPPSRVLNGPTDDQWLIPWTTHLKAKGVKFFLNQEATALNLIGNNINSVAITDHNTSTVNLISGDQYLLALPVEKAKNLITVPIVTADQSLNGIHALAKDTRWMNGIQYYLNTDVRINKGHVIFIDSAWAITAISQIQYWPSYPINTAFNGNVRGILSVDISDWETTIFNGKLAKDCSDKEIAEWTYKQIQDSLLAELPSPAFDFNVVVEKYHIGSSIRRPVLGPLINDEPLLVNKNCTSNLIPKSFSSIQNLFLAGDYVKTHTGLACMETANESARRAVNCIIDASGVHKPYAKVWKLREMPITYLCKWWDLRRYRRGLPYSSHYPWWFIILNFFWLILCTIRWVIVYLFHLVFGYTI